MIGAWPLEVALCGTGRWSGLRDRLGQTGRVQPGAIWLHGASLGEAGIARRLAHVLPNAFVTTDTTTGLTRADLLRPLDHGFTLAPLWSEARPRMLVFVESAWWPKLAHLAKSHGVPVVTVAARASRTAAARGAILGWPDAVVARDHDAARWFRDQGVVVLGVGGSLKGITLPQRALFDGPFIVGVCTRTGDERALIDARNRALPDHHLLLAPRQLERVEEVARLTPVLRASQVRDPVRADVVVDTLGELPAFLPGAAAAFIGGTFEPRIGGHSAAEAQAVGVPVFHGPHTHCNPISTGTLAPTRADLARALVAAVTSGPEPVPSDLSRTRRWLRECAGSPAPESAPRPWLAPIAAVWRQLPRRRLHTAKRLPIVAVGSDNARGAGKTSTGLWVASTLRDRGHTVGVITRGHGRRLSGVGDSEVHGVSADALGDEGALYALHGFRVVAHRDRRRALDLLDGCSVIVSEDGLQVGLPADLRVRTVDCRFPTGRAPLPAGERRSATAAADVVVAHHASPQFSAPSGSVLAERLVGPWNAPPGLERVAFAGIGRPADFFASFDPAETRAFPDHHRYSPLDLAGLRTWAGHRSLCTTDRDALRLPETHGVHWRGIQLAIPRFPVGMLP